MKTFAIGDVHGQFDALQQLLTMLPIDWQQDELVFLGDLVDRGPASRRVLELVQELTSFSTRVRVLRGNHEQVMLDSLSSKQSFDQWMRMGGQTTYAEYCPANLKRRWLTFLQELPAATRSFLAQLPTYYRNEHAIYVHAGARRSETGDWQIDSLETALWYRDMLFWKEYDGPTIVVGHTPTNKIRKMLNESLTPNSRMEAWQRGDIIAIDCGAGHNSQLCAVELPTRRFYYRPISRKKRAPWAA
ncbi:MAG: metallophosphoesterase family protein [Acidobacteriota bacterium]